MFDVGFGELVLLFVIGLLVLGPQRLPKVAAELGKWVGRARRTASDLRRQLEREIELSEITRPPPPPPPQTEVTPVPPDPYTPEAQHGHETHSSANGAASESAAAEPPAPAESAPAPAESAPAETPSQSQDPVHSPPQH